jgi:hypothetical protein
MGIHTVGDSHALFGWEGATIHHLGPKLCHSFGHSTMLFDINTFGLQESDTLVFCFGEIDCRCHVHKYVHPTVPFRHVIDKIVVNYIQAVQRTVGVLKVNLHKVCLFNVVPPVHKDTTAENFDYPYLGSDLDRKEYVLYFNQKLKEACHIHDFVFINVYDKYSDSDGFLNLDLSDGNVHIRDGSFITQFMDNHTL